MVQVVPVALGAHAYRIVIEAGLLDRAGAAMRTVTGDRPLVIVTDETVAALYLAPFTASLDAAGLCWQVVSVPPGEASKDLHRFADFAERLLALGLERRHVLVALGGGVVGDLCGFAAATLLRGLDFIQIPTTLLAQIDSSVGGKTGVNSRKGKNLVGAFHQPRLVLVDPSVLRTLPRRAFLAGYGEMVKYGLLGDGVFFDALVRDFPRLLALDPLLLEQAVARCCTMKAEIVVEDERETGRRALLNLGHTFGHALEAETGFGDALLHGEAVAVGLVLAAHLSVALGTLDAPSAARISAHIAETGLPATLTAIAGGPFAADRLLAHMQHDKKNDGGLLTFITLNGIGAAAVRRGVPSDAVEKILRAAGAV